MDYPFFLYQMEVRPYYIIFLSENTIRNCLNRKCKAFAVGKNHMSFVNTLS